MTIEEIYEKHGKCLVRHKNDSCRYIYKITARSLGDRDRFILEIMDNEMRYIGTSSIRADCDRVEHYMPPMPKKKIKLWKWAFQIKDSNDWTETVFFYPDEETAIERTGFRDLIKVENYFIEVDE